MRRAESSATPWGYWCWLRYQTRNGKRTSSGASVAWTGDLDWPMVALLRLLAEVVGPVRRQVRQRVGRLPAVAVFKVDVRAGRVARRSFIADQLALVHAIAGLHLEAEQVSIEGEEVVAVRHDDVVPVADQLPVEDAGVGGHHDSVIGRQDWAALLVGDVHAGMEVRVPEGRWFEHLAARPEEQCDGALLQGPDQRIFRRVTGTRIRQGEEVVLHPELRLLPGGLFCFGDELVLAGDFHVGDALREGRRLPVDGNQLVLHLADALAQPPFQVLLMSLLLQQRRLLTQEVGTVLISLLFLAAHQLLLGMQLGIDFADVLDELAGQVAEVLDSHRPV